MKYSTEFELEQLIAESEQNICPAPPGFAASVMREINKKTVTTVTVVPVLSRKLCAAVCFCSAAAIMLFTVSGFNWKIPDFFLSSPGKLSELLDTLKNLI